MSATTPGDAPRKGLARRTQAPEQTATYIGLIPIERTPTISSTTKERGYISLSTTT
jgi:hypothetical protein